MHDTGRAGDGKGSIARRNTVYNTGGPCIKFDGHESVIEYNHVYDGLRSRAGGSKDGSLVYTQRPSTSGSVVRYNWVHGAHAGTGSSPWGRGIGIRGDDRTRGLAVHHNVVWNCGGAGILVKGDDNKVHNNTVLDIGREEIPVGNYVLLPTDPENADKAKRSGPPVLDVQNMNSEAFNNIARTITTSWGRDPWPDNPNIYNNWQNADGSLHDLNR
jgi:hypothetical protein